MFVTPRQGQILQLVADGLSDKQIANRLGMSHRTVRAHLEKLFEKSGVANRAGVVAAWLSQRSTAPPARPLDECPFDRPFPSEFDGCPAYQAMEVTTLDLSFEPLGRIRTCRHLDTRQLDQPGHGWYGSCRLGDVKAREEWAAAVGIDRLSKIRILRKQMDTITTPFARRLWELKAQHLQAVSLGLEADELIRQMRSLAAEFFADINRFFNEHGAQLDDLHLPFDACAELVRVSVERVIGQATVSIEWDVPPEVVARFPEEVRVFLRAPGASRKMAADNAPYRARPAELLPMRPRSRGPRGLAS